MKRATRCKVRGCTSHLEYAERKKEECLKCQKGKRKRNCDTCEFRHKFPRYIRGFCERHYKRFYRGQIDENGKRLRELKHSGEKRYTKCKVNGCTRGPGKSGYFIRGFCSLHYSRFKAGIIDRDGKILRPLKKGMYTSCKMPGCNGLPDDKGHFRKGFCYRHYRQYYMKHINIDGKLINPDFKPRKG